MERITYQDIPKELFTKLRDLEIFIHHSGIDSTLLNLLKLRVSQINHCAYCLDMHYKEARLNGESELRLSMLAAWSETDVFSAKEKSILAYAEALTTLSSLQMESSFKRLENHFSKTEISMISLAITQINTWNRLMRAFNFKAGLYKVG